MRSEAQEPPSCLDVGFEKSNLNCEGGIHVGDILLTIDAALEFPLKGVLDSNGNGCPDTCDPVEPACPCKEGSVPVCEGVACALDCPNGYV